MRADAHMIAAFDRDTCLALVEIAAAAMEVERDRHLIDDCSLSTSIRRGRETEQKWDALITALAKVKE